jgi:hypothetical protein
MRSSLRFRESDGRADRALYLESPKRQIASSTAKTEITRHANEKHKETRAHFFQTALLALTASFLEQEVWHGTLT